MNDGMASEASEPAAEVKLPERSEPKAAPKPPIRAGGKLMAIVPRDLDEAWRFTESVIWAGMVPGSYEEKGTDGKLNVQATRAKLMLGIMKGLEIGLPPVTALSTIMIVNNRPSVWGDGAMALIQDSGKLEWKKEWYTGTEMADDWTAHCEMKRRGQAEVYAGRFSVSDAKRARLWANPKKAPWIDYPQRMLRWRAFSWPARDGFSDVLMGLGIAEEVMDMVPEAPALTDKSFLNDDPPAIEHHPAPEAGHGTAPATSAPPAEADTSAGAGDAPQAGTDTVAGSAASFDAEEAFQRAAERLAQCKLVKACNTLLATDPDVQGLGKHAPELFEAFGQKVRQRIEAIRNGQ